MQRNAKKLLDEFTSAVNEIGLAKVSEAINRAKMEYKSVDFKKVSRIIDIVCKNFKISKNHIMNKHVFGNSSYALMTCYCLIRKYEAYSDLELAKLFNKDRTGVFRLRKLEEKYRESKHPQDREAILKFDISEKQIKEIYNSETIKKK